MNRKRLFQTIGLFLKRGAQARGRYLKENHIFAEVGENVRFQPRLIPLYPELIKLHNNIMIAAGVRLITHDAAFTVLNYLGRGKFPEKVGCIEIMDNVFIGYNCTVLPNVRIGSNVIIGASSTVTKDLEPGGVYAGCPAKKIGSFEDYVQKCSPDIRGGGIRTHMLNIIRLFLKTKLTLRGSFLEKSAIEARWWIQKWFIKDYIEII